MKVLILILVLAAGALGQGRSTVKGHVSQGSVSGSGGSRSKVTLNSTNDPKIELSTEADAEGNFTFENVPAGRYRLTADGGLSSNKMFGEKVVDIISGQTSPLEIIVLRTDQIRESVTVAADSTQTIEQVSKTVDVISGQEMRDRADFTLIDTLRTIPGFRVQQLGGFGRTASIKARGLRNQDTAVLIDGIRFRDPGSIAGDATPFLSDFTLTSVDRIEVLRGSGSSLYGTNAVGGTIDFQTPTPRSGLHGQVSGAAGGLGLARFRGNISYGAPDNKFGISGAVSRTAYTEGIDGNDNASNTNFQSRIEFNPTG